LILRSARDPARVTYIGHATTLIEDAGSRVITDPVLSSRVLGLLRRRAPAPDSGLMDRLDGVLLSHFHHDHLDLASLRRLQDQPPIVVPLGGRRFLERRGFGNVVELAPGESTRFGSLGVTAVPAVHGGKARPGARDVGFLGYLIDGTASTYFAGDTDLFDGMSAIGDRDLDLALLPVWGWGPKLGGGHLDPVRAARALALLRPRIAVPIHWGTYTPLLAPRLWPWLQGDPGRRFAAHAAAAAPAVEVRVLQPGEGLVVA
jgi:L-ascorbate metabolism protein UlaG (beta-lactamase superfamily)